MTKHCVVGICSSPVHCAEIGECFSARSRRGTNPPPTYPKPPAPPGPPPVAKPIKECNDVTSKKKLIRSSVYVRLALAQDACAGLLLSAEDVIELMEFRVSSSLSDRAIRDAARAGYAIDDEKGLIPAPPGYAESVLGELK